MRRFVLVSIATTWSLYLSAALAETSPAVTEEAVPAIDGGPTQLLANPGFEEGASGWTSSGYDFAVNSSGAAHQGNYLAWLGGFGERNSETLYQDVSIPAGTHRATFSFWINIDTDETSRRNANDKLYVQVRTPEGHVLTTLATYSNLNRTGSYVQKTFDVSRFAGRDARIFLKVVEDNGKQTSFFLDDVILTVQ